MISNKNNINAMALGMAVGAGLIAMSPVQAATDNPLPPTGANTSRHASSGRVLEEVVVTVSKRKELVQDIAASVSPLSSSLIQELNILNVRDIANIIPNIVAKTAEKLSIRGIAAAGYQGSNAPQPVAQHVNGLFIAETGIESPYYDLSSIEVLRGPSGTVFGRNATAGAIDVRWQKPEGTLSGSIDYQVRETEHNNTGQLVRGYINAPLLDEKLAMRAAFAYDDIEATYDNLSASGSDDPNARQRQWYRIYLTSEPTEDISLGLRYIYQEDNHDQQVNSQPLEIRRNGLLQELGVSGLPENDVAKVNSGIIGNNVNNPFGSNGGSDLHRVDGDVTWNLDSVPVLGDIELFLIAGHTDSNIDILIDADGTEISMLDTINKFDRKQTTGEFRISSRGDGALSWIAGVFYSDFKMDVDVSLEGIAIDSGLAINLAGDSPQSTDNKSRAAFLSMEYDLSQAWDSAPDVVVFGGIRENKDKTKLSGDQQLFTSTAFNLGMPDAPFPLVLDLSKGEFSGSENFSKTTGEFGARWSFSENAMAYAKYANGYKAGKLQQIADGSTGKVEPEQLDAYEIGLKSRWLDNSLQLNAAAFYYDYKDLQVTQLIDALPLVENAADATIQGLELDMQYIPFENMTLLASLGYMDTEFDSFCSQDPYQPVTVVDSGCSAQKPQDLSGNELSDAPKWSGSLVAQYNLPLDDMGQVLFSVQSSYRDDFYRRPQNLEIDKVDSYFITDLRALWSSREGRYEVELFVENVADKDDVFLSSVTLSSPGMMSLLDYVPGRRYGASVRVNFF